MKPFTDWVISGGKMFFFLTKNFVVGDFKEGNDLELWNFQGWTAHIPKQRIYRWAIDHEGIFQIGSFLGKNNFFEKNFVMGEFRRRGWARAFKLGGMIKYIWGYGLLKKIHGPVIFVKIMAIFRKLDFTIFFKHSIWQ